MVLALNGAEGREESHIIDGSVIAGFITELCLRDWQLGMFFRKYVPFDWEESVQAEQLGDAYIKHQFVKPWERVIRILYRNLANKCSPVVADCHEFSDKPGAYPNSSIGSEVYFSPFLSLNNISRKEFLGKNIVRGGFNTAEVRALKIPFDFSSVASIRRLSDKSEGPYGISLTDNSYQRGMVDGRYGVYGGDVLEEIRGAQNRIRTILRKRI